MYLAVVRGPHLNAWDAGNYYGLTRLGHKLSFFYWAKPPQEINDLWRLYPEARFHSLDGGRHLLFFGGEPDVIDVPDMHYSFSQEIAKRFERTVSVAWDNRPGKNLSPGVAQAMQKVWRFTARSWLAQRELMWNGVPGDRIGIIPGAIDTDVFKPPADESDRLDDVILFVGRLTPEKGLQDLIFAAKGLDARLWVVGDGDQTPWRGMAEKSGVEAKFFGFVGRSELVEMYQKATVFCVPSLPVSSLDPFQAWMEQFGQVFIEAMACGCPVVSTMSGAIPEVLSGGAVTAASNHDIDEDQMACGELVWPGDWDDLHTALRLVLGSRVLRRSMSRYGRALAEGTYGYEPVAMKIEHWYGLADG